jgi:hypothetical protein
MVEGSESKKKMRRKRRYSICIREKRMERGRGGKVEVKAIG